MYSDKHKPCVVKACRSIENMNSHTAVNSVLSATPRREQKHMPGAGPCSKETSHETLVLLSCSFLTNTQNSPMAPFVDVPI